MAFQGTALRGRTLLVAALVLYSMLVGWGIHGRGWILGWERTHVHGGEPRFMDLTAVLQGLDRYRAGTPIWQIQSRAYEDANTLSAAYPSLWMWLFSPTRLGESQSVMMGVILALLTTTATILFLGRLTLPEGIYTALLLMSPSFMLGIERGNVDLFLFLILLPAIWLSSRRFRGSSVTAAAMILVAALLKLFPIGALLCLLRTRRLALILGSAGLFAVYCAVSVGELGRIAVNAGRDFSWSFGCMVAFDRLFYWLGRHGSTPAKGLLDLAGLVSAILLAAAAAGFTWRRAAARLEPDLPGLAFLAGAGIYLVCFLIGNNYAYRLRWLTLVLPQIFLWIRNRQPGWVRAAAVLAALLLSGVATHSETLRFVAEPANWLLFALLVSLSASTLKRDLEFVFSSLVPCGWRVVREGRTS